MARMTGKVALVTGAASGMGREHCLLFAEEGAQIVATDVNLEGVQETISQVKAQGGEGMALSHDVTSESDWSAVVDAAVKQFGRIDVLVNNAGIAHTGRVDETTLEDWQRVMNINATGPFLGIKAVVPAMRERGGSIINISSVYGLFGAAQACAYNASKGAVKLLSKAAAVDLAEYGIRVNSIHPGLIATAMTEEWIGTPAMDPLLARQIQHRAAQPREVSQVVLMLASDESSFMTGAEIAVDGGMSAQ